MKHEQELIELDYGLIFDIIGHFNEGEIEEESIVNFVGFSFLLIKDILEEDQMSEVKPQFLEIAVQTLSFSLENFKNCTYLISSILICISSLSEFIEPSAELLALFLSAEEVSETDIAEATENPCLFLQKVYFKSFGDQCETFSPAIHLILCMIKDDEELANSLLELDLSKMSARVIAWCSSKLVKKYQLGEQVLAWTSSAIYASCLMAQSVLRRAKLWIIRGCTLIFIGEKILIGALRA